MCLTCGDPALLHEQPLRRRAFLASAVAAAIAPTGYARAANETPKPQNIISPGAALERLLDGNRRFQKGAESRQDFYAERKALLGGQNPFAAILSCADSRLAPNYVFDSELGDLFNIRIAGNFAAPEVVASFEYAVKILRTPLLMVLGHEKCGAVEAALQTAKNGKRLPGHLPVLANAIAPAIRGVAAKPEDELAAVINHNIQINVERLRKSSPILDRALAEKRIRIVGGLYRLESGDVEILYP